MFCLVGFDLVGLVFRICLGNGVSGISGCFVGLTCSCYLFLGFV